MAIRRRSRAGYQPKGDDGPVVPPAGSSVRKPIRSLIERTCEQAEVSLDDVARWERTTDEIVIRTIVGREHRIRLSSVYAPIVERAIEKLGVDRATIRATPSHSPKAVTIYTTDGPKTIQVADL